MAEQHSKPGHRTLPLRAPLRSDVVALLALLGDPEVTKYLNVATISTLAEARAILERVDQRYAARDTIRWAIGLIEHNEMIGTVGLRVADHRPGVGEAVEAAQATLRAAGRDPSRLSRLHPPAREPAHVRV